MKHLTALSTILFGLCNVLSAAPTNTEFSKGENGEAITRVHYSGETDGAVLKTYYGNAPRFRLLVVQYDSTSKDYLEHSEYYNYNNTDPSNPIMSWSVDYYRNDDPDERQAKKVEKTGDVLNVTIKYRPGNRKNLLEEIIESQDSKNISIQQTTYEDTTKNADRASMIREYYDEKGETTLKVTKYAKNEQYLDEEVKKYQPPEFTQSKRKPFRTVQTYAAHPMGLLKTETEYDVKGAATSLSYFDYKSTKEGYTRMMRVTFGDRILRQIVYFDNLPMKGSIYFVVTVLNSDGSVTTKYFDKAGKEVAP